MHSMLKKSLLAITVAAAAAGSVQAQEIQFTSSVAVPGTGTTVNPTRISSEGLAIAEQVTIGTDITASFELESNVTENSVIRLLVAGADIDDSTNATLSLSGVALSSLGVDQDGAFIFNADNALNAGDVLVLSGVVLEDLSSSITVQGSTILAGNNIVTNVTPVTAIATVNSQFALGTGTSGNRQLNAVIDVEVMRTQFISSNVDTAPGGTNNRPNESVTVDNFFVSINSAQTDVLNTTVETATVALTGEDLSFLDTVNTAGDTVLDSNRFLLTSVNGAAAAGGTSAPALEGNTLTATTATDPGSYVGIALRPEGAAGTEPEQLEAQSFTADLTVQYDFGGTNGTVSAMGINAGAWTLSGATVNIPFMPYGPNFAQVIRLSNDGNVAGEIEVTAFDNEGQSFGPVVLSTLAAGGTITNIVPALNQALVAEGFDGSGDLDLTFVINSPAADIEIEANYRVLSANDRVGVTVINP